MADRKASKEKVIEVLNKARSMELFAITQYMNQHYNLDNLDYGELAKNMKLIAIDEMRHAEMFAERIKELGGEPSTASVGKVQKGQDVKAIFPFDSNLEDETVDQYNQFLNVCRTSGDSVSTSFLRPSSTRSRLTTTTLTMWTATSRPWRHLSLQDRRDPVPTEESQGLCGGWRSGVNFPSSV